MAEILCEVLWIWHIQLHHKWSSCCSGRCDGRPWGRFNFTQLQTRIHKYIYKSTQRVSSEHPGSNTAQSGPGLGFVPSFPAQTRGCRRWFLGGKKLNQPPDPCWDAARTGPSRSMSPHMLWCAACYPFSPRNILFFFQSANQKLKKATLFAVSWAPSSAQAWWHFKK